MSPLRSPYYDIGVLIRSTIVYFGMDNDVRHYIKIVKLYILPYDNYEIVPFMWPCPKPGYSHCVRMARSLYHIEISIAIFSMTSKERLVHARL